MDEGNWKWANGSQTSYTNWGEGEPNSYSDDEDYGMFYIDYPDGKWNDGLFDQPVFICEWDVEKFSDIPNTSYFSDAVLWATQNNITKGILSVPAPTGAAGAISQTLCGDGELCSTFTPAEPGGFLLSTRGCVVRSGPEGRQGGELFSSEVFSRGHIAFSLLVQFLF